MTQQHYESASFTSTPSGLDVPSTGLEIPSYDSHGSYHLPDMIDFPSYTTRVSVEGTDMHVQLRSEGFRCGQVTCSPHPFGFGVEMRDLWIDENDRMKGLGGALVHFTLGVVRSRFPICSEVTAIASPTNIAVRRVAQATGFVSRRLSDTQVLYTRQFWR